MPAGPVGGAVEGQSQSQPPNGQQYGDGNGFESASGDAAVLVAMARDSTRHTAASNAPSSVHGDERLALTWKHLTVTAKRRPEPLLKDVSGKITSGLYAIMGPSGSGKTTLLNTLACRLDRKTELTGDIRLNGHPYKLNELKKIAGYVMQDDLLNGNLTVEETLGYTAQLRLPPSMSPADKDARVTRVLEQVGLAHARHTLVGTPLKKGISGGERKRLCVAMELLTGPLLLFLDEPTSGLDSMTALSLVSLLKRLAKSNECTVVCTIHQPQSKIFKLFDQLILLRAGSILFSGSAENALDFFAVSGFPVPIHENPADHFLDVITPNREDSVQSIQREEALRSNYQPPEVDLNYGADKPIILPREQTPWTRQFRVLLRRTLVDQWRKKKILGIQILQNIIIAVLIGTAYLLIGHGQSSTSRRSSALFFCVINQGVFGSLVVINSFPAERTLILRERAAGTYYVSAYFLAKVVGESIVQIICPILFSCTVYFLIGFQVTAGKFFVFTAFMILCSTAATSLALMVSAIGRTTDMSVTVLPLLLEVCRLFGGLYLSPRNLPVYFSWLDALSYVKYSYVAISLNELDGLQLTCTPDERVGGPNGTCPVPDGAYTINDLGLDKLNIQNCAGILISYIVICQVAAYLGVRFIKH